MFFEIEIKNEIEIIKKTIDDNVKFITKEVFTNLCNNSPSPGLSPSSLGSYVLSHRINSESPDLSTTKITTINTNALNTALSNEISKLNQIEPFKTVIISNSIDYNEDVEYLGWGGFTGPYHTFQKTENTMETVAQQAMDRI